MSLGSNYNNDNQKKQYNPTVYSSYRMNNAESTVDPTCLTFTYWNNTLKVSICPKKNTGNDDISFDMDNCISVHLNHTKARILANELKLFLKDPETYNSSGVPVGASGLITISNGKEYGVSNPCLTIRKLDENGKISSSFAYQFKTDYYFSIRGYSETGDFHKEFGEYSNLEITQMITLLEEYFRAMTGAIAFTVIDQTKYENTRVNNKLEAIGLKLGVEFGNKSGGGTKKYNSSGSYFNNNSGNTSSTPSYNAASLDDYSTGTEE